MLSDKLLILINFMFILPQGWTWGVFYSKWHSSVLSIYRFISLLNIPPKFYASLLLGKLHALVYQSNILGK